MLHNRQLNGIYLAIRPCMEYDKGKSNKEKTYGEDHKFYH